MDQIHIHSTNGSSLLCEHFTARDAITGNLINRFKLSEHRNSLSSLVSISVANVLLLFSLWLVCQHASHDSKLLLMVFIVIMYVLYITYSTPLVDSADTVVVVSDIGMQLIIGHKRWSGRGGSSRFIPLSQINDVIINEAIYRHSIIYYLAVLVQSTTENKDIEVVPLFTSQMPRLNTIMTIYKSLKSTLNLPQDI